MKIHRFCSTAAAFVALSSSAFAQLTWDTAPGTVGAGDSTITSGAGTWDTTTGNWTSDAGANNVAWVNGNSATFGDSGGDYIVNIADGGVTVGDLTHSGTNKLTFQSVTDNLGVITIATGTGGATWDTGGGEIEFVNDTVNDTRLDITSGDTLTVQGGGTFDAGEAPADSNWVGAGATLDFTAATTVLGDGFTVGQFGTVKLAGGSTFTHTPNSNRTYANNWDLGAGTFTFTSANADKFIAFSGIVSGAGKLRVADLGTGNQLPLNNNDNSFSGGLEIDNSRVQTNELRLGAVPVAFDADNIKIMNGGQLRIFQNQTLNANRGITVENGASIEATGGGAITIGGAGGAITGTGGLTFGRAGQATGTYLLSGVSDYTGGTTIYEGNVRLEVDGALGGGVVTIGGENASRLLLNGKTQTIGGLTTAGSNTRNLFNLNTTATPAGNTGTLIIDVADGDSYTFGSAYGANSTQEKGNFHTIKNGLGTQTITNMQVGGDLTVNAGLMVVSDANAVHAGDTSVTGGTLRVNDVLTSGTFATSGTGTLQIGNAGTTGSIGTTDIANDGAVVVNRSDAFSYDGVISGSGVVTVSTGNAAVTLTQAQTYLGNTTFDKAVFNAQMANALSADSAVILGGAGTGTSAFNVNGFDQEIGGLAFVSGSHSRELRNGGGSVATLTLNVATGESYSWTANVSGANAINIVKTGDGTQSFGRSGGYSTNLGDLTVSGGEMIWANTDAATLGGAITVGAAGTFTVGNGATNGTIDNKNVANAGTVNFNRSDAVTYSGDISGAGGLQLNGGVTLTLDGSNTFTGPIEVLDGTLILGSAAAIAEYDEIDVAAGEVFMISYEGTDWTSDEVAGVSGLSTSINWLDVTGSAYLGLGLTGSISLDHAASGNHGLWVAGAANTDELTFSVDQTYIGNTYIDRGVIKLTADDQLPATAVLTLAGSGGRSRFELNGFSQTIGGLTTAGTNTRQVSNTGVSASTLTIDVASGKYTYGSNFNGTGIINIVKDGPGEQAFDRTSALTNYTGTAGTATVNEGTLAFRHPDPIDPATNTITVQSGATFRIEAGNGNEWLTADIDSLIANAAFQAGSFLSVHSFDSSFVATSAITGDLGLIKTGDATLTLSGTNTYTGTTSINGTSFIIIDGDARLGAVPGAPTTDHLTINGGGLQAAAALTIDANRGITLGDNGGTFANELLAMTVAAPITGTGSLTLDGAGGVGAGFLELTGTNDYTGETILSQGSLKVASADNLPATSNLRINGTAILLIDGDLDTGNAADFTRDLGTDAGEVQWTNGGGFAASGADRSVDLGGAGANLTWSGVGAPAGGFMPGGNPTTFTFFLSAPEATHTLTLVNGLILPSADNYSFGIVDSVAEVDSAISGIISGDGGLRVRLGGTLALEGDNTYLHTTIVDDSSTLLVNGDQSGATGAVSVTDGATLGGTGTVGGAVTVQSGGTITAGASAGTLTVSSMSLEDGSNVTVEIDAWNNGAVTAGTDADLVVVTGELTVAGTITVVIPSTPGDFTEDSASFSIVTFATSSGSPTINVDDTAWTGAGTWAVSVDGDSVDLQYTAAAPSDPFTAWEGTEAFAADTNGDGVDNGLAWILGAADVNADALALLPDGAESTGALVMTFTIVDDIAPHQLFVDYGSDLNSLAQTEILVASGPGSYDPNAVVNIVIATGASGFYDVTVTITPALPVDELFGRLSAIQN